jgi:GNAT superfamily N-acetyltransferase
MKIQITEQQLHCIFENIDVDIQKELDDIIDKYENLGMALWIYYTESNNTIKISSIKIKDKSLRRQGLGSSLMGEITSLADKYSLTCILTPDGSETSLNVLKRFYGDFGFIPNKGRYKDFRFMDTMIRIPQ